MSEPDESRANFCYRHPDRQSFVLCQRCGRTICGECQTPAPVGVICPECMAEQRASAPRTRSPLVKRTRRLATPGQPAVTYAIMGICILAWLVESLPGIGGHVTNALQYAGVYSYPGPVFQPWRMLTSLAVHYSILHIGLNMYTLWIFGKVLEPVVGRGRYLTLFLVSGFGGSVGVLLLASPLVAVGGASGALFGLFGALIVIHRRLGGNITQLLVLLAINLVISFIPGFNIAWQAHLGGLVIGSLVGWIFIETRGRALFGRQVGLVALLSVVLVAASFLHFVA
ncbi:MAG TPA: rhomboid family intramembrane serine protease [Microbacteriaceae bacterium]|nr:rhomboid family intramembrane serine protease [Microbacteriaceae bacterium]